MIIPIIRVSIFFMLILTLFICLGQAVSAQFPGLFLSIAGGEIIVIAILTYIQKKYNL